MQYRTLGDFREEIERELDLQEESFISPDEMDGYIREGIDLAETEIIGLYEDYFLDKTEWAAITSPIQLPTNIYANKIRRLELRQNSDDTGFQINKNSHLKPSRLAYNIYNKLGANPYVEIEGEHSNTEYRMFFIRNANKPVLDADLIDLPEVSIHFIKSFVRAKCYEKEIDPRTASAKGEIGLYKQAMVDSLANIVDDGSEILSSDMSFYEEFDEQQYFY